MRRNDQAFPKPSSSCWSKPARTLTTSVSLIQHFKKRLQCLAVLGHGVCPLSHRQAGRGTCRLHERSPGDGVWPLRDRGADQGGEQRGSRASSRGIRHCLTLRGIGSLRLSKEVTLLPEEAEGGTPSYLPRPASLPLLKVLSPPVGCQQSVVKLRA